MKEKAANLHKRLQRKVGEALGTFGLIERGDRILIGLSGGKDSLALLDLLGERMTRSGGYFEVEALHVRMRGVDYESDTAYLEQMAARYHIPLHVVETGFEPDRNEKRTPCFLCSWHRRKQLFEQAQLLHCNKIALGHHLDDLLRTAMMNLTFNGAFSTMAVKQPYRKMPLTIIRPLALIPESDLRLWAELQHYQPVCKICPHDRETNRTHIENVLQEMERLNPDYRSNFLRALQTRNADTQL